MLAEAEWLRAVAECEAAEKEADEKATFEDRRNALLKAQKAGEEAASTMRTVASEASSTKDAQTAEAKRRAHGALGRARVAAGGGGLSADGAAGRRGGPARSLGFEAGAVRAAVRLWRRE